MRFSPDGITFTRTDIADVDELAASLPLWQRIQHVIARGPLTLAAIANQLEAKPDSIDRTIRKHKNLFTRLSGGNGEQTKIALVERRAS